MTLQESVHFALTRNERARISDLNVVVAEAAVEKARVAFLPVVTALGNDIQHAYAPPNNNIGTASLTVTQNVVNLPAFPLYAQARKLADAQHDQNVDDRRLLEFAAANAYFTVLDAQDVVTAAQRQLDNSKSNLADTQARAESGLTSTNDVTRAQVDTTSAVAEVEKDKGNLDNAFMQLAFALNAPVPSALVPPKETLAAAEQPPGNPDTLVRLALDRRPDLLVAKYQAIAAQDYAAEPLLRIAPVLGVQGQVAGTTFPSGAHPWNDENIQATLTWTIYDAGNRYADKHSRDAQLEIASLNVQNLARNIDAQVRSAVALLVSAQAQFHIADDTVKYARQNVEETAVLYRQGLAKAIELVDASDSRFTAEVAYAAAEFTMAQAYLNLRQALGLGALGTELK
jgi:outer membrane protein TolC